jgi:hypothetical protein
MDEEVSWARTGEAASRPAIATGSNLVRKEWFIEIQPLKKFARKAWEQTEGVPCPLATVLSD